VIADRLGHTSGQDLSRCVRPPVQRGRRASGRPTGWSARRSRCGPSAAQGKSSTFPAKRKPAPDQEFRLWALEELNLW